MGGSRSFPSASLAEYLLPKERSELCAVEEDCYFPNPPRLRGSTSEREEKSNCCPHHFEGKKSSWLGAFVLHVHDRGSIPISYGPKSLSRVNLGTTGCVPPPKKGLRVYGIHLPRQGSNPSLPSLLNLTRHKATFGHVPPPPLGQGVQGRSGWTQREPHHPGGD